MPFIVYGSITNYDPRPKYVNPNFPTIYFTATFGQPSAIFSTVWVNAEYSGPIFYLRGNNSGANTNIYSDGSYNYYTSASLSGQKLAQWMASNTPADTKVYVVKWYDQSGLGRDASQNTAALQPSFNTTSYYVDFTDNGNSYFNLPNGTVPNKTSGNNNYTISAKHGTVTGSGSTGVGTVCTTGTFNLSNNANAVIFNNASSGNTNKYQNAWGGVDYFSSGAYAVGNTATLKFDSTVGTYGTVYWYINNGATADTTITVGSTKTYNATNTPVYLGALYISGSLDYYFNSQLYFLYMFPFAMSDANRNILKI